MRNDEQIFELILDMKNDMKEMNNRMEDGFKDVQNEMTGMKSDINGIKSDMTGMKSDINGIKSDMTGMKTETAGMKSDIRDIKMTLENEINKNIRIIAEGHVNLSHKLDEALKIENEKEVLLIRLTILENEVSRIKARLEEIA